MLVRRLVALAGLGLALTACGSSDRTTHGNAPGPLMPVAPSPIAFRFTAAANRTFARRDARRLLRTVVVPRAARRVVVVPRSAPKWFREELSHGTPGSAVIHRTWVIHQPLKQVVRFIRTHWRPVARPEWPFNRWTTRIGSRPGDSYQFRPIPGRSSNRWLNVSELALPTGATVVTAQAGDQWIKPPPRSAELPRNIRTIDITSRYGNRRPVVRLHVGNRYDVGSIVSWTNGLGVSPNYICFGGFWGGPAVTLTFRGGGGKTVAKVVEGGSTGGPCGSLSLTVKGRKAPPLLTGDLLLRIDRLLDANLAPPLLRDVARCLRWRGWHARTKGRTLVARQDGPPTTLIFRATGKITTTGPRHRAIARCLRSSPRIGSFG